MYALQFLFKCQKRDVGKFQEKLVMMFLAQNVKKFQTKYARIFVLKYHEEFAPRYPPSNA